MRHCRLFFAVSLLAALLQAQPVLIAHGCYALTASGGTTGALTTTGANFIVAFVAWNFGDGGDITVTDSKLNSYTSLTAYTGFVGYPDVRMHYTAVAPTVGTGHTWTVSGSSLITPGICVQAWSGMAQPAPFDAGKESGNGGYFITSVTVGSITPTSGPKLIITGVGPSYHTSAPFSVDSSFTNYEGVSGVSLVNWGAGIASLYQADGAAINPTWTTSDANIMTACQAAFKVYVPRVHRIVTVVN